MSIDIHGHFSDFITKIQIQVPLVVKMDTNNVSAHTLIDEPQDVVQRTSLKALGASFHQDVLIRADFYIFPSVKELFPTTAL